MFAPFRNEECPRKNILIIVMVVILATVPEVPSRIIVHHYARTILRAVKASLPSRWQ